jgi:predicted nucleotide-binding protein (sugar kinase/HSP70/actin superfamily)
MKIGIPRALIYWKKRYFWEEFFNHLGCQTLLSPLTNKEIVQRGVKAADPETCFSTKIYWGHLLWLEGKCDLIFIPLLKTKRLKDINSKEILEYCPKFFGLPDLAQILVKTPILTQTFDESKESFKQSIYKLAHKLDRKRLIASRAMKKALSKEKKEKERINKEFILKMKSPKPKIVLISHPYNLYDPYVNLRTEEKLKKLGTIPIFIDQVPVKNQNPRPNDLSFKVDFHWEFGKEIIARIREIFKYDVTGGVQISSFQCGCDAVLKEVVEREFKNKKTPFLYLLVDEHTGEAGLQTRLEAFVDTIL